MSHRRSISIRCFIALFAVALLTGCDSQSLDTEIQLTVDELVSGLVTEQNPSGYAPLTAEVSFNVTQPIHVDMIMTGQNGGKNLVTRFYNISDSVTLPILGLYPESTNEVVLRFITAGEQVIGDLPVSIDTPVLWADLPQIDINVIQESRIKPGMNLVSYFGHNSSFAPQKPFIFDSEGVIRWYLDFTDHPSLSSLFFDNGVERLANGNLFFGDRPHGRIVEVDMLGNIVQTWPMPGYEFHHHVLEKPNGNFLVTVDKQGEPTVEDYIIEIDRISGATIREWNLKESLDYARREWPTNFGDQNVDWFHANGLAYDPLDDTIIVSGRTQGTVKLTNTNEVVWILAPHRGWGTAGDGANLSFKLLSPLDKNGALIRDPLVVDGTSNHADFEWAWYQHAPEIMPDGSLLLFDNGDNRNYGVSELYSRAVHYVIDQQAMTVQQRWQYGKERGADGFSRIVSDVDYHIEENNVVFMPGAVGREAIPYGKVVEIDYSSRNVVFEATITAPIAQWGITFHRVERISLYPN